MSYHKFSRRFLAEMPQQLNGGNPYDAISSIIQELLSANITVESLGNNTFRIASGNSVYYWIGSADGNQIRLCSNVDEDGNFAKITSTGKNPNLLKTEPYAIDLYLRIANSLPHGVKFSCDAILSDDGFNVWKRIFNSGHELVIYNNRSEKFNADRIKSAAELENYFKNHPEARQYQYGIAESAIAIGIKGDFSIMEWKRLANYPLAQLFNE
jgi:hypothetical protein